VAAAAQAATDVVAERATKVTRLDDTLRAGGLAATAETEARAVARALKHAQKQAASDAVEAAREVGRLAKEANR